MPVTVKVQDHPYARTYHITVRLLADRGAVPHYYRGHEADRLTDTGREIINAADDVPGVDHIGVSVYAFNVFPAAAFDATSVYSEVLEAVSAVVAGWGETLEVSHPLAVRPPTPDQLARMEEVWPK